MHRAEIAMPPPQSGFHHEVESDLIERLAAEAIVEPAQGYGGLIILAPERSIEQPLLNRGREPGPCATRVH